MQKFCTHCGKKLAEVLKFCTYCGAPLGARPLNPKLVMEASAPSAVEDQASEAMQEEVVEDTSLEFLPLDFKPLEAAVLRKETPMAGETASSGEAAEEGAASPIVKAAEIVPAEEAAGEAVAAVAVEAEEKETPEQGDAAAEQDHAASEPSDAAAEQSATTEGALAAAEETNAGDEGKRGEAVSAAAAAPTEAAPSATAAAAPKEEKKGETAKAEGSGSVVSWLFRFLLFAVLIIGGLMVYRGIGFDKLREDPAGAVQMLLGQEPAVSGTKDDAFWYPDTKQGALVRGTYDVASGRTVCWYGGTVQKDGRTYADGDGVANWYKSDGSFEQSDEGVFIAGRRNGKIKHTYADGRVETAQWKNGEKVK